MCLILDKNMYGSFFDPKNADMEPVRKWMKKQKGKIVYSPTRKMKKELWNHGKMRIIFDNYRRAGKLKLVDKAAVEAEKKNLPELKSDDPDIIALARVSNVKLLVSADKPLHADFKDIIQGKIYQTRQHRRLLKRDTCP